MSTFRRIALLSVSLVTLAAAPRLMAQTAPPPPSYEEIKKAFEVTIADPAIRSHEKEKSLIQGLDRDAMPTLIRLFDEREDDAWRSAVVTAMIGNRWTREAAAQFLAPRLPADGKDWHERWQTSALANLADLIPNASGLAAKALQSPDPYTRLQALFILASHGGPDVIATIQADAAKKPIPSPYELHMEGRMTPGMAIDQIIYRGEWEDAPLPSHDEIGKILGELADQSPVKMPAARRAALMKQLRANQTLWQQLFKETPDDNKRTILVEAAFAGQGSHPETLVFLKSSLPKNSAEWDRKWIMDFLANAGVEDLMTGRDLGMTALVSPTDAVRDMGVEIVSRIGSPAERRILDQASGSPYTADLKRALAGIDKRWAAEADLPAGYSTVRELAEVYPYGYERRLDYRDMEVRWCRLGADSLPALQRLFDSSRDDSFRSFIACKILILAKGGQAPIQFLLSRAPGEVDDWSHEWIGNIISSAADANPDLVRPLALKMLTAANGQRRHEGLELLAQTGREENISILEKLLEEHLQKLSVAPPALVGKEIKATIADIKRRADMERHGMADGNRFLRILYLQDSQILDDENQGRFRWSVKRASQIGDEALPVWEYMLNEDISESAFYRLVNSMVCGQADRKKIADLLKTKIPADISRWEEMRWIQTAIFEISAADPPAGRELALKALACRSDSYRESAATILGECGQEDDIPLLQQAADRPEEGDPGKRFSHPHDAALEAIRLIRQKLAPPEELDSKYVTIKEAMERCVAVPSGEDGEESEEKLDARGRIAEAIEDKTAILQRLFLDKKDDHWRTEVVDLAAIIYMPQKGLFDTIISELPDNPEDWNQTWISEFLRKTPEPLDRRVLRSLLLKGLKAPNEEIQVSAISALREMAYREDIPAFKEIISRHPIQDPPLKIEDPVAAAFIALMKISEIWEIPGPYFQ